MADERLIQYRNSLIKEIEDCERIIEPDGACHSKSYQLTQKYAEENLRVYTSVRDKLYEIFPELKPEE